MKKPLTLFTLFYLLLSFLFYGRFLSAELVITYRDTLSLLLGLEEARSVLSQFSWPPLWNPWMVLGKPFAADMLTGAYYPPLLLTDSLSAPLRLGIMLVSHHFLAALGTALLCSAFGLGRIPALAAGTLYSFGGFLVSCDAFSNALYSATWFPWAFLSLWSWLRSPRMEYLLATGAIFALMFLGALPEVWAMTLACYAVIIVGVAAGTKAQKFRALWIFLLVLPILVLGLFGILVIPLAEYLALSQRASGLGSEQVLTYSHHPLSTLAFLIPRRYEETGIAWDLFGQRLHWVASLYLGVALLLIPFALPRLQRKAGLLFAGTLLGFLTLAGGYFVPLLPTIVDSFSLFRVFRYPEKLLLVPHLGLAIAVGFGLEAIGSSPRSFRTLKYITSFTALIFFLVIMKLPREATGALAFLSTDSIQLLAFVFGLALIASFGEKFPKASLRCVVLLITFDLFVMHGRLFPVTRWRTLTAPSSIFANADWQGGLPRIYSNALQKDAFLDSAQKLNIARELMPFGSGMLQHIANLNSPSSLNSADDEQLLLLIERLPRDLVAPMLGALGVRYVTSISELHYPGLVRSFETTTDPVIRRYTVTSSKPRAYLAQGVLAVKDRADFVQALQEGRLNPETTAVVEMPVQFTVPAPSASDQVQITRYLPDEVEVRAETEQGGMLVLADVFYPGWEASLDAKEVPMYRAQGFLRAVQLPAGAHIVRFKYAPNSFTLGAWCSLFTLLVIVFMYLKKRRT